MHGDGDIDRGDKTMSDEVKKALLILNPKAGKMKIKKNMFNLVKAFCEEGYATTVLTTLKQGDAVAYAKAYAKNHDICICCGGDGTLNEVITGLFLSDSFPPIGLIPAGSTNDMARTLNLSTHIHSACNVIMNGTPIYHDIGLMNNELYFSYICSFGAFTKVSYKTPQWAKNIFGKSAYIVDGIKQVSKIHPYKMHIKADDTELHGEFLFGSISNAKSIAGLLRFNESDVDLNDGKFEVLLVKNPPKAINLPEIFDNLMRKKYDNPNVVFLHASNIEIEFEEGSEASFTTDGEFAGRHKKVVIENLHNRVQILQKTK